MTSPFFNSSGEIRGLVGGRIILEGNPKEIVLDVDATDDPVHGHQEGRFFHGDYRPYGYLALYIFCAEHLLCARLRRSNIDAAAGTVDELERIVAQVRIVWPKVRIVLRGDSGFCREEIMHWCEAHQVDGSVAKFSLNGELCAIAGARGWRMNDFKGRHFEGVVVLWAVRW